MRKGKDPDPDPLQCLRIREAQKHADPDPQYRQNGKKNVVYPRLPEPADQKTQEAASGDDTNSGG